MKINNTKVFCAMVNVVIHAICVTMIDPPFVKVSIEHRVFDGMLGSILV